MMTTLWLATALALYLTLVHEGSFSSEVVSARLAIVIAILLMDLAIAWSVARPSTATALFRRRHGRIALRLLALAALVVVAVLHADYLLARFWNVRTVVTFTFPAVKTWIVATQVAFVFLMAALTAPAERLAHIGRVDWRALGIDVALLALPLVPLVNYFARNRSELTALASIEYFALFLLVPALLYCLLVLLQRLLGARPWAAPVVAGMAFAHYTMPMVSEAARRPVEMLFAVQLSLVVLSTALLVSFAVANRRLLAQAVAFFVFASGVGSFVSGQAPGVAREASPADAYSNDSGFDELSALMSAKATTRPDVYLLIYDSYGAPDMVAHYGIDNRDAMSFLSAHEFTTYPGAYSLFHASRPSMGALFDMRVAPQAGIGGANRTLRFFKGQGYRTHLIFSAYLAGGSGKFGADVVFPSPSRRAGAETLYRGVAGGEFKAEIALYDSPHQEWLAAKRAALVAAPDEPKFVYAHSRYPGHSQNSGRCLPDETASYSMRLEEANREMRTDVEAIIATGRPSIIIAAGDHGPYLTGDCLFLDGRAPETITADELRDRYGALLAIRWPHGTAAPGPDRIRTLQDVFVAVSASMLDDKRVYAYRLPARTFGYRGIPHDAVRDGIVQVGPDRGRPLFPR